MKKARIDPGDGAVNTMLSLLFMEPSSPFPPHILCAQTARHEPGQPQAFTRADSLLGSAAASPIILLHLANSTPSSGAQIKSAFLCLPEAVPGAVPVIKPTSEGLVILYLEALLPANL